MYAIPWMVAKFYTSWGMWQKKTMGFNMFQPSKGGAGFRKNPQLSTVHFSKQWLSGFSTQQWLLYSDSALHLTSVFWDSDCSPYTLSVNVERKSRSQAQTWVHFLGYTADLHRNTTGWNPYGSYLKRLDNNLLSEKKNIYKDYGNTPW